MLGKLYRSPLFYVGDKYKLMSQLKLLFPQNISTFYDVFCGGGSASINANAKNYVLNDINSKVIELHNLLIENSNDINSFIEKMHRHIKEYGLSHSEIILPSGINNYKKLYPKTYFAEYNKKSYRILRQDYNKNHDVEKLYLLLIYGFNHMIRFNSKNEFNLPVGNLDWNKNVTDALLNYSNWANESKQIKLFSLDFINFLNISILKKNDFLYFDPPYLITNSEYNKIWTKDDDLRLYDYLDDLNNRDIKWGLSNMLNHKDKTNEYLLKWAKKYKTYSISSNYISRFDNSIKNGSKEIYVTNVSKEN